ncbi:MAG: response regulator, partial [Anaerolineae bacterium]
GIGIPEEFLNKLFTPFFTTKGGGNAGMGLSVAREIVARHGGTIRVESTVGKGSTFSVCLPIADYVQPHDFREELAMTEHARIQRSLSILVVEDEESIRRLLSSILGLEGHEVRTFRTASEGIAAFAERQADLVITDLGLPDQSGWEVARQIKAASAKTPVILITGWGVSAEVTEARRRGVDYILSKPFEFEELSELISKALGDLGQR